MGHGHRLNLIYEISSDRTLQGIHIIEDTDEPILVWVEVVTVLEFINRNGVLAVEICLELLLILHQFVSDAVK